MYTLKELSDKAFQELLDSGLSYKTVYGANWYIWNRLIRLHGEDALFEEWMVYDYCEDYFGKDIYVNNVKKDMFSHSIICYSQIKTYLLRN